MTTTTAEASSRETSIIIALISAMLVWGSSWISGKIIADMAPSQVTVFYRIALAVISMLPTLYFMQKLKLISLRCSYQAIIWSLPAGAFMAMYNQLFFMGLVDGLPGKGGMLVTTTNPVFTFLLSFLLFRMALSTKQILGLVFGLVGGLLMIEVWRFNYGEIFASGNAFFLLASITWAALTLISKQGTRFSDFLTFSTLMYLWATIISYIFAYEFNPLSSITNYSSTYWYHMLYLSIVVVSIATSIFFLATQKLGANRSSSFIFIVPVTAMGLSVWYFGEQLSLAVSLGGAFALCAVYLLNQPVKPSSE
ncbi:DMT family transporter [Pseudoalteromonas luteoviolacea]|uniref:DMT family transporter n=1 Tax=Pseudoalteromonas luteoviolacea TaxID=43657 RepID=UPI001B3746E9|nr:DMT family transporter [Pseudoalteromonas luteoviolacea]MBQ4814325.1 DMT family transporter [Pseudoalteromonas luteoviolacea]